MQTLNYHPLHVNLNIHPYSFSSYIRRLTTHIVFRALTMISVLKPTKEANYLSNLALKQTSSSFLKSFYITKYIFGSVNIDIIQKVSRKIIIYYLISIMTLK